LTGGAPASPFSARAAAIAQACAHFRSSTGLFCYQLRMPELRRDPLSGRWVVIAADRAFRPANTSGGALAKEGALCPFCPGREGSTPPEILAYRQEGSAANGPGWTVRVVPSRTPALTVEGGLSRSGDGLYDRVSGIGAHEVIIDSPDHARDLGDLPAEQVEAVLWATRERIQDLRRDLRLRACMVFRNRGFAPAPEHGHSQIIALPIVPQEIEDALARARDHHQAHERCLLCDLIVQEKRDAVRIVAENAEAMVLAPFAARSPFETWVLPLRHQSNFEELERGPARGLAEMLRLALRKLDISLERPAYRLSLHSAPLREPALPYFHWFIRIAPALSGARLGDGVQFNPVAPEEAAAFLRGIAD
jgi:UDPglucose--hexose-1-phosphate uridylyltransferase